jgi:triacylglycerol lipase
MRYRHSGTEIYLDRHGDIRRLTKAQKAKDRSRGFWTALRRRQIDHFSDHSIGEYIRHIARAAGVPPRG